MKPKVILDTNILLDLFYFRDESVEYLFKCLKNFEIDAYTCESIWAEFEEVLARKPFLNTQDQINQLRIEHQNLFIWKSPEKKAPYKCRDTDDQVFVDLAVEIAPSIIISKDNHLLKMSKKLSTLGIKTLKSYLAEEKA
jgi:putative PIN family toxin of toxin-antitoxin system